MGCLTFTLKITPSGVYYKKYRGKDMKEYLWNYKLDKLNFIILYKIIPNDIYYVITKSYIFKRITILFDIKINYCQKIKILENIKIYYELSFFLVIILII